MALPSPAVSTCCDWDKLAQPVREHSFESAWVVSLSLRVGQSPWAPEWPSFHTFSSYLYLSVQCPILLYNVSRTLIGVFTGNVNADCAIQSGQWSKFRRADRPAMSINMPSYNEHAAGPVKSWQEHGRGKRYHGSLLKTKVAWKLWLWSRMLAGAVQNFPFCLTRDWNTHCTCIRFSPQVHPWRSPLSQKKRGAPCF